MLFRSDEFVTYLSSGKPGYSQPPDVADYERFFAEKLTLAQNVIHITMAKHTSTGYQNALEAARSFHNITVLDSGHLSCSLGLAAMYAASMAENHATKEEILEALERLKRRISSTCIIDSTHMMCQAGLISKRVQVLCDTLLLHPIVVLRKSKITVGGIEIGGFARVAKNYVRRTLRNAGYIDRRILFIVYAGMDEASLIYIQDLVKQYGRFERVYLQKASAAIASNCGPRSFGLLFMRK